MGSLFLTKYPFQTTVIASVVAFMLLNAFVPLNFSAQAETTKYPFKLTLALEKTTYKLREPINLTLHLQNIGEQSVLTDLREFDSIIYDENLNEIYRWSKDHGWIANVPPATEIEPWKILNVTYMTWYQSIGFTRVGPGEIEYYWAKPGAYYVTGLFYSYYYNVTLETPAIRITIA